MLQEHVVIMLRLYKEAFRKITTLFVFPKSQSNDCSTMKIIAKHVVTEFFSNSFGKEYCLKFGNEYCL
jgi:hypothetical protein